MLTIKQIILDTNVFDKLPDFIGKIKKSVNKGYKYYITNIQMEELLKIPDIKKEKKIKNRFILSELKAEILPISQAPDHRIINYSYSNLDDALIANTAVSKGCILITEDKDLYKRMDKHGLDVMDLSEFLSIIDNC